MQKKNYHAECESIIAGITDYGKRPGLLLHTCCAPCASAVIEYLEKYFELTIFFYNPNITRAEEYAYRLNELKKFIGIRGGNEIEIISPDYDKYEFLDAVLGCEASEEGGERCRMCYRLRLERTAEAAAAGKFEYFTTTLSVSPYKNSGLLCQIGVELEKKYNVSYLYSDFKKKGGYVRSIELSKEYGLYRQDYCGCIYSENEAKRRRIIKHIDAEQRIKGQI